MLQLLIIVYRTCQVTMSSYQSPLRLDTNNWAKICLWWLFWFNTLKTSTWPQKIRIYYYIQYIIKFVPCSLYAAITNNSLSNASRNYEFLSAPLTRDENIGLKYVREDLFYSIRKKLAPGHKKSEFVTICSIRQGKSCNL